MRTILVLTTLIFILKVIVWLLRGRFKNKFAYLVMLNYVCIQALMILRFSLKGGSQADLDDHRGKYYPMAESFLHSLLLAPSMGFALIYWVLTSLANVYIANKSEDFTEYQFLFFFSVSVFISVLCLGLTFILQKRELRRFFEWQTAN